MTCYPSHRRLPYAQSKHSKGLWPATQRAAAGRLYRVVWAIRRTTQHPAARTTAVCAAQEKERAAREEKARSRYFVIGKYAYERGQYQKAVEALETALDREGPFSQLGGDIQLWLALAYNVRVPAKARCIAWVIGGHHARQAAECQDQPAL